MRRERPDRLASGRSLDYRVQLGGPGGARRGLLVPDYARSDCAHSTVSVHPERPVWPPLLVFTGPVSSQRCNPDSPGPPASSWMAATMHLALAPYRHHAIARLGLKQASAAALCSAERGRVSNAQDNRAGPATGRRRERSCAVAFRLSFLASALFGATAGPEHPYSGFCRMRSAV